MTEATEDLSPQAETLEPAKGLDAIISGALDEAKYGEDPAPVKEEPEAPKSDDRPRDEHGRFIPKDPAKDTPSEPEPAKAEATTAEPVKVPEPAPVVVQPIEPPARWSEAEKADFAKLTPDGQRLVVERYKAMEADYTRKTQEVAETRKAVEPLIQEVGKWSPYLRQLGVTPDQAFTQMLTTEYTLRTGTPDQKAQALAYLAQLYGVPTQQQAADGTHQAPDPAITQLHQTVSGLQSQLRQLHEQKVLEERQRAQAEFDALGKATDQNGTLKFPHFARVNSTMIQLVASGQADTWDAAYSKAVRLDDDLYKQTVEAERQRVAAEADRARLEAVEKAKKATPVKTSDGQPRGGAKLSGLDAHLSAAMDRLGV